MSRSRDRERRRARRRAFEASLHEDAVPMVPQPGTAQEHPPRRAVEGDELWVDLLHERPLVPAQEDALRGLFRFSFESGDAGALAVATMDEAPLAPSGWKAEHFAEGLFLESFIAKLFDLQLPEGTFVPRRKHLLRFLSAPPSDLEDVRLRQGVLRELEAKPELRRRVGKLYARLQNLMNLLGQQTLSIGETIARKVEVLQNIAGIIDDAAAHFVDAESALRRLGEMAEGLMKLPVHGRLREVLEFEANLATVDVRVVLGSDGRIRDFQLQRVEDNLANPLVRPAWQRAFTRLWGWLRGHRYTEHEVLLKVIDDIIEDFEGALLPWLRILAQLEVYLGAFAFRERCEEAGLKVCLPEVAAAPRLDAPAEPWSFDGLFNPLLLMSGVTPVPCGFSPAGHDALVLITGPNSGGKTRLLQSLGLAQVLGQCGLFVPARAGAITMAPSMFVSLIEQGAADQAEGRLGTELLRVRRLFEGLEPGSMAILDELCSGTNPSEGIAIFEMVIGLLPRLRPQVLLTTHFLDAARALEENPVAERLEFLQVELDGAAGPTYQFVPGVAGTSLAHQVAGRLGVTHEELEALVLRQERKARA